MMRIMIHASREDCGVIPKSSFPGQNETPPSWLDVETLRYTAKQICEFGLGLHCPFKQCRLRRCLN